MKEDDILITCVMLIIIGIVLMVSPFIAGIIILLAGFLGIIFRSEVLRALTLPARSPTSTSLPPPTQKFCASCGKEVPKDAMFCPHCGKGQEK